MYCKNPIEHIFIIQKVKILGLLKRVESQLNSQNLTVIIDTYKDSEKCVLWLEEELRKGPFDITKISVKRIESCRGLEFPVLVTITDGCDLENMKSFTLVVTRQNYERLIEK